MERDFLGLCSKKGYVTVKEEANDEPKNSGFFFSPLLLAYSTIGININ